MWKYRDSFLLIFPAIKHSFKLKHSHVTFIVSLCLQISITPQDPMTHNEGSFIYEIENVTYSGWFHSDPREHSCKGKPVQ